MNNWYNRINGIQPNVQEPRYMNQMQKMQYIYNALRNPSAFVKEQFPDVPNEIINNPNAVLDYLQRTRGSQFAQQLQQISGMPGGR